MNMDTAFLDLYDADLSLTARYKMANTLFDYRLDGKRPKEFLGEVFIDREKMLHALIISQMDPPRLVKYELNY